MSGRQMDIILRNGKKERTVPLLISILILIHCNALHCVISETINQCMVEEDLCMYDICTYFRTVHYRRKYGGEW